MLAEPVKNQITPGVSHSAESQGLASLSVKELGEWPASVFQELKLSTSGAVSCPLMDFSGSSGKSPPTAWHGTARAAHQG